MSPLPAPHNSKEDQKLTEVISPAEAKFWQEWADKAPGLVRKELVETVGRFNTAMMP